MEEVGASPIEVLELLCQNLGPESSKQAKTIKACNADNPNVAISKIFDRLEKRFGAPELIEKHLHKKIKNFPDVTVDKYYLLYDLLDLALEILSIKGQPRFNVLFSYFDSNMVVNELAEKLPCNLKKKWVFEATSLIRKKSQAFCNPQNFKQSRSEYRERNVNEQPSRLVRARKTETVVSSDLSNVIFCPLHLNGKHVLNDCIPFRQKPIEERKKIILVNGVVVARNTEQRTVRQQYSVTFVGPHHTLPLYMKLSRCQVKKLNFGLLLNTCQNFRFLKGRVQVICNALNTLPITILQ
ncbi:hypothetical protein KUTeg_011821 [Tegillarca granosa]|uniref:Uncharacterized protein n=1 Tax=Tegillarca granosa TaxID=220873 RepID=A0ABQ9F174_TEGGR|nr:hypothetical protein KUTeg_011821 [Tegillarca granosa]